MVGQNAMNIVVMRNKLITLHSILIYYGVLYTYLFNFHAFKYVDKLIYIYLLLLYDSSITDIHHSPNYMAFSLPQTHEVR